MAPLILASFGCGRLQCTIYISYQEDMYIKPDAFLFKFLKFERGFGT